MNISVIIDSLRSRFADLVDRRKKVVVCGYPRSGNTWTTRLVAEALSAPVGGFYRDYAGNYRRREVAIEGIERANKHNIVLYKSHHDAQFFERKDISVIFVVRDPRDVALSAMSYFYGTKDPVALEQVFDVMSGAKVSGKPWFGNWNQYITEWLNRDPLILRYEDLICDPEAELSRAFKVLELEYSHSGVVSAIENNSSGNRLAQGDSHVVVAKAERYRSELSDSQLEACGQLFGNTLETLGYSRT